jgi:hypothetical protein
MEVYRQLRWLRGLLTSDAQRRYLEALAAHPEVWDSIGVPGEGAFLAEQLGLSRANARQLHSRIRGLLRAEDGPDAA